jgi:hypothetical protein
MPMSLEAFQEVLTAPRWSFMLDTVTGCLADYDDPAFYGPAARRDHTPSVRAAIRNAHMIGRAKRAVVAAPQLGIRLHTKGNRVTFIIADKVRVSFKRLNKSLRPRNYPTPRALAILDQRRHK